MLRRTAAGQKPGADVFGGRGERQVGRRSGPRAGVQEGAITGKNDTEREASARRYCPDLFDALAETGQASRTARHHLDLAALAVEELRLLLRLDELAAYTEAGITPPSHNGG